MPCVCSALVDVDNIYENEIAHMKVCQRHLGMHLPATHTQNQLQHTVHSRNQQKLANIKKEQQQQQQGGGIQPTDIKCPRSLFPCPTDSYKIKGRFS